MKFLKFLALVPVIAVAIFLTTPAPVRALVENQAFGIFGVTPVLTQPSGAAQAALTDSTGGSPGTTLSANSGIMIVSFPVHFASMTTGAVNLVNAYTPGFNFKVVGATLAVTNVGTGSGATQTINLEIGSTAVTGGVINPTLSTCGTVGALVAGTSVTAANVGTNTSTFSIQAASGGTVFTAGDGVILVTLQNLDTANSFSSLSNLTNAVRTAGVSLGLWKGSN